MSLTWFAIGGVAGLLVYLAIAAFIQWRYFR